MKVTLLQGMVLVDLPHPSGTSRAQAAASLAYAAITPT